MEKNSKKLSYWLRHKPEDINLTMNDDGYVILDDLVKNSSISYEEIYKIVEEDSKNRYEISQDKKLIRARQGHSIPHINPDIIESIPPNILYHGTSNKNYNLIKKSGCILPMSRNYVHLSEDNNTAKLVGNRHEKEYEDPIILIIDSLKMFNDGYKFFLSSNNVWLSKSIPIEYIKDG